MVVGNSDAHAAASPFKEDTGMRVNLHWPEGHKGIDMKGLSLGKNINVTLKGKIKGLDIHSYGSSLDLLVPFKDVKVKGGSMGGDIKQLRSQRVMPS